MSEPNKENKKGILLMLLSALFACVGQLLWKVYVEFGIYILFIGFLLYGLGALLMTIAYKFGELSVLQPILSLNYVLSLCIGAIYLHETVTIRRIIGALVIMLGVIFIIKGAKE